MQSVVYSAFLNFLNLILSQSVWTGPVILKKLSGVQLDVNRRNITTQYQAVNVFVWE